MKIRRSFPKLSDFATNHIDIYLFSMYVYGSILGTAAFRVLYTSRYLVSKDSEATPCRLPR
jgi:hypothetical protein